MCYSTKVPDYVAREIGAKVIRIPHHVHALPGCDTYIEFLDTLVKSIADAGRQVYGLPPRVAAGDPGASPNPTPIP